MFENGSEVVRVDFHLHTRKDREFKYTGEDTSFITEYVAALVNKQIRIGVITNHNKFDLDEFKALRKSARKNDILILPGVELSVKEGANGLHTLIVFDPDTWIHNGSDDINKLLDSVFAGIDNRASANARCRCDLPSIIDALDAYGKDYFIVFAHVDQDNGLFEECSGGLLSSLASEAKLCQRVLGLQKVRERDRFSKLPAFWNTKIAKVEGSDPKKISDIGKNGSNCYVKIGDLSYGALKYALSDFANRVFSDVPQLNHGYVKTIHFDGGRLSDQNVGLSTQLNTMIGIRGSGKSSVLEALRYALALEPSQDSEYKKDLVKHVLSDGGKITLSVVDEHGEEYRIERIYGERPVVISKSGEALPLSPSVILKNPLYFGQKDLAMSKAGYELDLLNKLVGNNIPSNTEELRKTIAALSSSVRHYLEIRTLPDRIRELEEKDREFDHKLQVFKERGITERLAKQTAYKTDIAKVDEISKALGTVISAYETFVEKYDTAGIQLSGYVSQYNSESFSKVQALIDSVNAHVTAMTQHAMGMEADKANLGIVYAELVAATDALREEFAQIKREIADDSIDFEGFEKYQSGKISGRAAIDKLTLSMKTKDSVQQSLVDGFRKRNELLRQTYLAYQREIERINASQTELAISIDFKGDKEQFVDQLRTAFKGTRITDAKYQRISEEFTDIAAIIEDHFLNDGTRLKVIISDREYSAMVEKIESNFDELIAFETPNYVRITYHGKELRKHSMGQRASALMLFILSQEDNDIIIIDQPEDDLDNQVIYTEFVKTLRGKKAAAQFVFATHNANIPVLGDAEKVIAAQYTENTIELTSGSIDTPASHKKIVEIMEGGYEAFQRRNAIYKSWQ